MYKRQGPDAGGTLGVGECADGIAAVGLDVAQVAHVLYHADAVAQEDLVALGGGGVGRDRLHGDIDVYKRQGLHYVKAMGIALEERNLAQVTMNLTDYTKSSIYSVFEMVKMEARRYGVRVVGSEVVGIVPMKALLDCAEYYLQIEDFSSCLLYTSRCV